MVRCVLDELKKCENFETIEQTINIMKIKEDYLPYNYEQKDDQLIIIIDALRVLEGKRINSDAIINLNELFKNIVPFKKGINIEDFFLQLGVYYTKDGSNLILQFPKLIGQYIDRHLKKESTCALKLTSFIGENIETAMLAEAFVCCSIWQVLMYCYNHDRCLSHYYPFLGEYYLDKEPIFDIIPGISKNKKDSINNVNQMIVDTDNANDNDNNDSENEEVNNQSKNADDDDKKENNQSKIDVSLNLTEFCQRINNNFYQRPGLFLPKTRKSFSVDIFCFLNYDLLIQVKAGKTKIYPKDLYAEIQKAVELSKHLIKKQLFIFICNCYSSCIKRQFKPIGNDDMIFNEGDYLSLDNEQFSNFKSKMDLGNIFFLFLENPQESNVLNFTFPENNFTVILFSEEK